MSAQQRAAARLWAIASASIAGARLGWGRLRRPVLVVALLLALGVALATGLIEHAAAPHGAPDRALGVVFRWVAPLLGFAVATSALGAERAADSVWVLARYGLSRRWLVLGLALATLAASGLLTVACAELALVAAYGARPGFGTDAWTSAGIALLGASAYVAWIFAGATVGRRGRGRIVPLLGDFTLGFGVGAFALPWPRAHLRSLLGDLPVAALSPSASSVVLAATTVACLVLVLARSGE